MERETLQLSLERRSCERGKGISHTNLKRGSLKSLSSVKFCVLESAVVPLHKNSKLSTNFSKTVSNVLCFSFSDKRLWCTSQIKKFHRRGFDTRGTTGTTRPETMDQVKGQGTTSSDKGVNSVCQQDPKKKTLKTQRLPIKNIFETLGRRLQSYRRHN